MFFSSDFDPELCLQSEGENGTSLEAADSMDELERQLMRKDPKLVQLICELDKQAKGKSKKQEKRERVERLEAMTASQDRLLFEKKVKPQPGSRRGKQKYRPRGAVLTGRPTASSAQPSNTTSPLVKLTIVDG